MRPLPLDAGTNFLLRHAPRQRLRSDVRVLVLGCEALRELCGVVVEGFPTTAIDGDAGAVSLARERLELDGLGADLHVGQFPTLPFADATFDLAIDLGALRGLGRSTAKGTLRELARVLKPSGRVFLNPFSDRHSGARSGRIGPDDLMLDVDGPSEHSRGALCFWNANQVTAALVEDWRVLSRQHVEFEAQERPSGAVHAEWRLIVEKVA
jgi:ubiquinone/menaquinone biosynthesis C-methylase UbiE